MSLSTWIAPLIEECLVSYTRTLEGAQSANTRLEDDGCNLRFLNLPKQQALINRWSESERPCTANLTDSHTQIKAIITQQSLEEYRREFPGCPIGDDICKGHLILLANFELVFEYSSPEPRVNLYVKQFRISWDLAQNKGPPRGKVARKNASLYKLMKQVYNNIKSRQKPRASAFDNDVMRDDSPASQVFEHNDSNYSQGGTLMSQVPPNQFYTTTTTINLRNGPTLMQARGCLEHPRAPSRDRTSSPTSRLSSHPPLNALAGGNLTRPMSSGLEDNEKFPARSGIQEIKLQPKQTTKSRPSTPRACSQRKPSSAIPERQSDFKGQGESSTPEKSLERNISSGGHKPLKQHQRREEPPAKEQAVDNLSIPGQYEEISSQEEQCQSAVEMPNQVGTLVGPQCPPQVALKNAGSHTVNPSKTRDSNFVDAWSGRAEIRPRDVTVPKDQCMLIDHLDSRVWVPVSAKGSLLPGYLPPSLLSEWNNAVLRRNTKAKDKVPSCSKLERADLNRSSPSLKSPASQGYSDSEGAPVSDWSDSSSERASSPHRQLPADSSPLRPKPTDLGTVKRKVLMSNLGGDEVPNMSASEVLNSEIRDARPLASGTHLSSSLPAPQCEGGERANEELTLGSDNLPRECSSHRRGLGSDVGSDDSVLSVSIPCPLYGDSQQDLSSQPGPDISSSDSSLPHSSSRQVVQVTVTPTAIIRTSPHPKNGPKFGLQNPELSSSQADNFSSQSRILNTYASWDGDSHGESSQDTSHSIQANEPDHLSQRSGLMRTAVTNEIVRTREPTPCPGSMSVCDSSGPANSESSEHIATSTFRSEHSNLFASSHDNPQSTIISVERQSSKSSAQSPMQRSPARSAPTYSLKRTASESENISEKPSPSKRTKADHGLVKGTNGIETHDTILVRRERYLSHSGPPSEAYEIYEKFQNDYPSYAGEFNEFIKVCFKLSEYRHTGCLQRSFLWDDFVIRHHNDYPNYLKQCLLDETKTLSYEEYFSMNFSKPSYKKRSLTVKGIVSCATHFTSINSSTIPLAPSKTLDGPTTSFTSSLRDQFSNLHAHSSDPVSPNAQSNTYANVVPPDSDNADKDSGTITNSQEEERNEGRDEGRNEERDEESDALMEDAHETASIELGGDDSQPLAIPSMRSSPGASSELDADETLEDNWFLSLRHIYSGPAWSDGYNTPFKEWARADQNVLIERQARGGEYIPLDKRGVTQHPNWQRR